MCCGIIFTVQFSKKELYGESKVSVKELEDVFDKSYELEVNNKIEERIKELAKSPEATEGGIEGVYKKARERIIAEYMKKRLEKEPKTKEEIAMVEKRFKEKGKEKGEKKDINKFMSDVLLKKGRLENLSDDFDDDDKRAMGGFLREWGIPANISTTKGLSKAEYLKAKKNPTVFFGMMMKVIKKALKI